MPLKGSEDWPVIGPDAAFVAPPRASPKRLFVYAIDGKSGQDVKDEVAAIVWTYVATCREADLDPLLVFSQLLVETKCLNASSRKLPHLDSVGSTGPANPAAGPWSAQIPHLQPVGVVAPTDPRAGPWFSSLLRAARTHAGLVLAYALEKDAENATQRTLIGEALRWRPEADRLRGAAPTLDGLADVWPADKDYPARIRDIADTILQPQW